MDEANTPPSDNICEVCGEPVELHITEIDKAGQASVRHVCSDHVMPPAVWDQMAEEMKIERRAGRNQRRRST